MTPRCVHRFCLIGLLVLTGVVVSPGFSPGADKEVERVLALLQRQQDGAKVVRIRAEGKKFTRKGGLSEFVASYKDTIRPPEDVTVDLKQDFLLDFRGGRYRRVYQDVYDIDGKVHTWIQVFDGKKVYGSRIDVPVEQAEGLRPARMTVISGGDHVNSFNSPWWPYFLSQGFILTRSGVSKYYWHNFRPPIDAENLFVHRQEAVRGRACDILQTFPEGPKKDSVFFEYAIDREDGTVRRAILRVGGGVKDVDIHIDYRRAGERMVPTRWTNERYTAKSSKPWQTETITVTAVDLSAEVEDTRFVLTPQAGTIVKEEQYPNGPINILENKVEKTATYQADESGRLVEGELVNGEFRPYRGWFWWLIGGLLLLVLFTGLTYGRVRSRRSPAAPPGSPVNGGPS